MINKKIKNIKVKKKKPGRFSKINQYLINILISLSTIILIFCVGELLMRVILPPSPKNIGQLYRVGWNRNYRNSAFISNAEVIHRGVPTKINTLGLKNIEIDLHKPKNTFRILMFGDSFTYGLGLLINETLPSQLERKLNMNKNGSITTQVLNFGVSGMNTFQEVMYALNYGLKFDPDIIMIVWIFNDIEMNGYTTHDFNSFTKTGTLPKIEKKGFPSLAREERIGSFKGEKSIIMRFWNFYEKLKIKSKLIYFFGTRTKELLQKFGLNLKTSEKVIYSDLDSDGFQLSFNSLKFINNKLNKIGIEFYTILYPPLQKLNDDYYNDLINKKVEEYCIKNNINCLNLFDYFRGEKPSKLHTSTIDYHPNGYANKIASIALDKYIKQKSKLFGMK